MFKNKSTRFHPSVVECSLIEIPANSFPLAAKEKETLSSEEVMKKLAQRQESLKHEAQASAATHNLPSYLNPSMVNPQLYAKQQEKRKLLWSHKKSEEVSWHVVLL